ncbi:flagellar hook-associated protein FlgK [Opitutales bacterium ASA1]|uniref:flagellar hook-associated protein FlgK n=1 Tax=Congregicoccus parvus TaxID=3081749 RepID=UPI002B2D2E8F|nr:flagellar hook-associated protein FlgK [Opitutales bacterium ASA1]
MSGLFGELQRTSQALNAQSQGIYTAGRNMANVNNSAYSRQRVQLGDQGIVQTTLGPQSLGVTALALQNVRDSLLDRQVIRETSSASSLQAQSEAFQKAELALGQQIDRQADAEYIEGATNTGSTSGIGESLDDLLNAFSSLAASPRSDAERQVLYQKALTFVSRMQTVDARLEDVQQDMNDSVLVDLRKVNDLLGTISNLNQQIGRFEVGAPGSALDLRDQRQARLEELAQYIDLEVQEVGTTGQIQILSRDAANAPVVLLDQSNTPPPVSFDGTSITAGAPATALTLRGGSIQGYLAARDGTIAGMRTNLDALAAQVVTSVNDAYNPGGTSTDFFVAGGTTAATIAVDPTLTVASIRSTNTAEPGANDVALAIGALADARFSTAGGDSIDGTFGSFYRGIVSDIANATASSRSRFEDQTTLKGLVLARRDSVSGVSLDEEMTDLIKYQRAFDASAKVMRVIDEMLETVVNGLAR